MKERPVIVCLGNAKPDQRSYDGMKSVGRLLAQRGYTVATGGYSGIMAAAAEGAREVGGIAIGYTLPGFAIDPNPFLTEVVRCDSVYTHCPTPVSLQEQFFIRLNRLVSGNGFIISAGGGIGSGLELLAIGLMICKIWKGAQRAKPIAILDVRDKIETNRGWDVNMFRQLASWGLWPEEIEPFFRITTTPDQAVDWATVRSEPA